MRPVHAWFWTNAPRARILDTMALETAHLELLAALLDRSTLAAASDAINLSPSAASRRLQDAERLVGVALTERQGRTITLTPAGRLLAEASAAAARQVSDAELAARWLGASGPRPVMVSVGFFDAIAWLLPRQDVVPYEIVRAKPAADYRQPDLTIDVAGADITGANQAAPPWEVLGADRLMLVVSDGHRLAAKPEVAVADMVDERYLASSTDPLPGFEFERFFLPSGDCPATIATIDSFSLLLELVARNEGITIQPSRAVVEAPVSGLSLVPLDRPISVSWVARRNDASDHRVDRILEFAGDLFDGHTGDRSL